MVFATRIDPDEDPGTDQKMDRIRIGSSLDEWLSKDAESSVLAEERRD